VARILAIDYGQKRVGIAVTDPMQIISTGLCTVTANEAVDFLKKYVAKEAVEQIVVGYPRQNNNTASDNAHFVEKFVEKLKKALPTHPIEYFDERFTSKIAMRTMIDGGLGKKARQDKALVDEISATIILQDYMLFKSNSFLK
jgi:putative Holliday junction resolvase